MVVLFIVVTQPEFFEIESQTSSLIDERVLREHVYSLAKVLPPRSDDPDKLDRSAEYIRDVLLSYGDAKYQEFDVGGITYRNVVLRLGPEAGVLFVVGAHYDAAGGLPGADDNASGVAGLLELGRVLSRTALRGPVELVAYALEEPPYFGTRDMGSYRHAARLKAEGREPTLMLSLEMIGYFRDEPGSQTYPLPGLRYLYSNRGDFISVIGRLREIAAVRKIKRLFRANTDLPIYSLTAPPLVPGMTFSDHLNYWSHGFNAVMITDTAFMRNPNYHTASDTPDTLDYSRMAKVVEGVYGVVKSFSN